MSKLLEKVALKNFEKIMIILFLIETKADFIETISNVT